MQIHAPISDRLRIMLVDDDDSVREAVAEILSRKGWMVTDFNSAEAAINDLKEKEYDIILADINMPGMTGIELLHKAKEVAPSVPVVMITGYPSIDLAVEAMKVGAVDFLPKPFKAEELEIIIRKAAGEAKVVRVRSDDTSITPAQDRNFGKMPEIARRRLEDKIRELSILHTISETLDDAHDKDEIYRKTMDIGLIISDAESAFVLVSETNGTELVVRASSGFKDSIPNGGRYKTSIEPFASIIKSRSYSYLTTEDVEIGALLNDGVPGKRRPLILFPLLINKEVLAMLGLNGKELSANDMTSENFALLTNLVAKASVKLENIVLSENIFSSIIGALNSLINALDARDTYTKDHSHRVTEYAMKIARIMNCRQEIFDSISFTGPLHDIGKIGIRDDILLKTSGFTINEREIMKTHVLRGEEILRPLNLLDREKAVILYHHERWDGSGYPHGFGGTDIPEVARIFTVADTYDAMTSTRPYRKALAVDVAIREIIHCKGTQFDPRVVEAFLETDIVTVKI